ncbi:MAG: SOS response-associated peptidase [Bacteroidetes bacterium]|jgi:putative SOS response-associated peptidase YedK|nr:SOS response-associated peptidase [Bacteroidota bacterium]MBT3747845.1 SOS response-associated peptidase [Bacteroidota bacterium]MBT4399444.1 SOS response-associated peptidase [Bacteroidota bacterium]MBT4410016.1 SOS response-associated peptidase [Bacteroidota bacterium]MBT5425786.1 SOS response-associated peptidase [Bacteroidota bacterium]
MCVFLSIRMDKAQIKKRFDATYVEEEFFGRKYIQSAFEFSGWPVIPSDQPEKLVQMKWGLIPHWVRDEEGAKKIRANTVNARIESVEEKPSFRSAVKNKRCLILANGFFEFHELNKQKYPYYIQLKKGVPFAIAGIFDEWTNRESGEIVRSFSVLTTKANPLLEKIHNRKKRMPVILRPDLEKSWIGREIHPADLKNQNIEHEMEAWPVSRLITSREKERNSEEVIKRYHYPELEMLNMLNL